ncbi:hypothetical protein B296_00026052, partial [Ensete ventricosum]
VLPQAQLASTFVDVVSYQRPNWQSLGNAIVCEEPQQQRMFAVMINQPLLRGRN